MTALSRTFLDADGVRWGVGARLDGEGRDAVPGQFTFTSQYGERRVLDGPRADCASWEGFCEPDWRELPAAARVTRPPGPHNRKRAARRRRRGK
jgi:hypothetical protein